MRYEANVKVTVGRESKVELPARVFCGRLTGDMFDTDKTFLLPEALTAMREVKRYYDEHPHLEVVVVGHTDTRGTDGRNRDLSLARAKIVAAFLTDDTGAWSAAFDDASPGKPWGVLEEQYMLAGLGFLDAIPTGRPSKAAWERFQTAQGLAVSGESDAASRQALVEKYVQQEETTLPAGTAIKVLGCGAQHPLARGEGDAAHRQNRRVEVYLFEGPIEPAAPEHCPGGSCPARETWRKRAKEIVHLADSPAAAVHMSLRWPLDALRRLPRGVVLRLRGSDTTQERSLDRAERADGHIELGFDPVPRGEPLSLEATVGGETLTLWSDRSAGDLAVDAPWLDMLGDDPEADDGDDGEPVLMKTGRPEG